MTLSASFIDELVRPFEETSPPIERPLHVLYGGAHLFSAGSSEKIGHRAREALSTSTPEAFARAIGIAIANAEEVWRRVHEKLAEHPVEAMCIDFEDGYGPRPDAEEDADAERTAREIEAYRGRTVIGIRIKALGRRALRTLDLFVTALAPNVPPRFTVTLPKVTSPDQVQALVTALSKLESMLSLPQIGIELMVETPRALFDRGRVAIPALIEAGSGRVVALHLGAYDLTAELGVSAGEQRLDHPYCDLARMLLQLTAGSVGVSDGATTVLPIKGSDIHHAWALHAANVRRAIDVGIWQGWDLHPGQLPARYGVVFAHFLERKAELTARLRSFVERATQASRVGQVFDDAATGQGLLVFFLRGLACGALDDDDLRATSLTADELTGRSFARIVERRMV